MATALLVLLAAPLVAAQQLRYARVETDSAASETLGRLDTHARAISCINGGYFTSLSVNEVDGRVAGFKLCCSEGSLLWFEGSALDKLDTSGCIWFGVRGDDAADGAGPRLPLLACDVNCCSCYS